MEDRETDADYFASLLDTAPDAIVVVGDDARIQLVNRQTEVLFGYPRAVLVGRPLEFLIPERFRGAHAGHLRTYFAAPSARSMGSGLRLFGVRADGSELPIEVSLSPQQGPRGRTVSAAIRDITERVRLEAVARLTEGRLASAMQSIQDAFALFDANDRLIACNQAYAELVAGGDPASLIGREYRSLLAGWLENVAFADTSARATFFDERLANRDAPTSVFEIHTRDGRRLRVVDRRTPEGGIVKLISDLTAEERAAAELREARIAAEAASAAKSAFLSSMSHELRTPLNAILGFAQLLDGDRKEPLSDRHRERLAHILHGGEHLLHLIDDILDLAKIEQGRVSVHVEAVRVGDVLADVQATLRPLAQSRATVISIAGELDRCVAADRTRLAQIAMNFGSNAVKYGRASGTVRFEASVASAGRIRIAVHDDGPGITRDQQAKLFQPFQRAGQESGPIEGTGIGLVISKQLAELMGGSVGFASEPGAGSTFWIELPATPVTPPAGS